MKDKIEQAAKAYASITHKGAMPWEQTNQPRYEGFKEGAEWALSSIGGEEKLIKVLSKVSELKGIQPASTFYQLPFELMDEIKEILSRVTVTPNRESGEPNTEDIKRQVLAILEGFKDRLQGDVFNAEDQVGDKLTVVEWDDIETSYNDLVERYKSTGKIKE